MNAIVKGFNLSTISLPQVDFLIETETVIEREPPARIYQQGDATY